MSEELGDAINQDELKWWQTSNPVIGFIFLALWWTFITLAIGAVLSWLGIV